jgi:ABC-2 type transport system ATP-binding protein
VLPVVRREGPETVLAAVEPDRHAHLASFTSQNATDEGTPDMIEAHGLTKVYGDKRAVDDLSFTVRPGTVTGFLGPNGAGKSTTMRMIVGLDRPDAGAAHISGRAYQEAPAPLQEVGAHLDARVAHPGRSARNTLLALAQTNGIPAKRVDEVLGIVGLSEVGSQRSGGFSLGMGQRLGIAAALLGDPGVLILDEPVNGLDPEGILWVRNLLKHLASEGRTVLVSSHLMSEMALTAEHLVVIGRGRLLADTTVEAFIESSSQRSVRIVSPHAAALRDRLVAAGGVVSHDGGSGLDVTGLDQVVVGDVAAAAGATVHELRTQQPSLEEAFMELTRDSVEYSATTTMTDATVVGVDRSAV